MAVELFRYRGAAKDGGTLEYVFDAGEQHPLRSGFSAFLKEGPRAVMTCMCQRPVSLNSPVSLLVVLRTDSGLSLEGFRHSEWSQREGLCR
jgi:hypothetical protein